MNLKDQPHYDDGAAVAVPSPLLLPFYGNGTCSCSGGQVVKASSQVLPFCLRYIQYSYIIFVSIKYPSDETRTNFLRVFN